MVASHVLADGDGDAEERIEEERPQVDPVERLVSVDGLDNVQPGLPDHLLPDLVRGEDLLLLVDSAQERMISDSPQF